MSGNSRPFMDFLREHRNGITHDDLSDALQAVVAGVIEEGKVGTLTLTIKIKPLGQSDGLEVSAEVKAAPPKPTPGVSIFFATPENNLARQDPHQMTMELREIGPAAVHKGVA
jgi:hypothetical protein